DDPTLARACEKAGIAFVGPTPEDLVLYRDRFSIRHAAFDAGLRILPGSERPIREPSELRADVEHLGLPLAIKPAFGLGEADTLPVLETPEDVERVIAEMEWEGAACYVERHVDRPR